MDIRRFLNSRMNLNEEMNAVQAEIALQQVEDLATEIQLGRPLVQQVQEQIQFEVRPARGRGRPPIRDVSVLRRRLQEFRRTSQVGSILDINLRGNLTLRQGIETIVNELRPIMNEQFAVFTDTGDYYTISPRTADRLRRVLTGEVEEQSFESDGDIIRTIRRADSLSFERLPDRNPNQRQRRGGAFFKWLNKTSLDLSRQGVFKIFNRDAMSKSCLVYALEMGGLDEIKLDNIKCSLRCHKIPVCQLKKICEDNEICIELRQLFIQENRTSDRKRVSFKKVYGDKNNQTFQIGLVDDHYFLIEKKNITSYAFQHHYNDSTKFNVYNKRGDKDRKRQTDTFKLIKIMFENKETHLEPITLDNNIMSTPYYNNVDEFGSLEYMKSNTKYIHPEEEEERKEWGDNYTKQELGELEEWFRSDERFNSIGVDFEQQTIRESRGTKIIEYDDIIVADFETNTSEDSHIPYLCCYSNLKHLNKSYDFLGRDCALQMLKSLKGNTIIYFHNAMYDFRFLLQYCFQLKPITNGSSLVCCTGKFLNNDTGKVIHIKIKCSYKLITAPLRKFGKMFGLKIEKEVMPYSAYTTENILRKNIPLEKLQECIELKYDKDAKYPSEEYERFLTNCKRWNVIKDGYVDIITYSLKYCQIDCRVLGLGLNKFRKMMLEVTEIDLHEKVSIPQIAHDFFINRGVYLGVKKISGIPRAFIQRCVVGGRTMTCENKKILKEECMISDYDAVSLYPSAMQRLARIGGFLMGSPKVLKNLTYDFLQKQDGYFVKILVKEVGKHLKFPLMSYVNDDKVRTFTNDMVGKYLFVDRFMLEDLIEFQQIKFDVIQGYYFNEGRNDKIGQIIKYLFDERLKKKGEKNPIQMIYKLLMNSSYGKTLLKPIESNTRVFDSKKDMNKFVSTYFDSVIDAHTITYNNSKWVVNTIKSISNHFNVVHVGVEILSMSKRIMNEVMCLGEELGLHMYYQDTDSIHIDMQDVPYLEYHYQKKYNRTLRGKGMNQFHPDFEMDGCRDIVSVDFIALGKKCYIDHLRGIDKKTGLVKYGFHIRLKGVSQGSIYYEVNRDNTLNDVLDLYKKMYNGESYTFDLLEGGRKCSFQSDKGFGIGSLEKFERCVQFV